MTIKSLVGRVSLAALSLLIASQAGDLISNDGSRNVIVPFLGNTLCLGAMAVLLFRGSLPFRRALLLSIGFLLTGLTWLHVLPLSHTAGTISGAAFVFAFVCVDAYGRRKEHSAEGRM